MKLNAQQRRIRREANKLIRRRRIKGTLQWTVRVGPKGPSMQEMHHRYKKEIETVKKEIYVPGKKETKKILSKVKK